MALDLYSIEYLNQGSERQRRAYSALKSLRIFEILASPKSEEFSGGGLAALAGSVPLNIAFDDSDLDVIAYASDLKMFSNFLKTEFSHFENFRSTRGIVLGVPTLLTSFRYENETIEVFTQNLPVPIQNAIVHLLVEERLLSLGGSSFREKIMEQRNSGLKTEPAFGEVLGLEDPYRGLLEFESFSDNELRARFSSRF